MSGVVANILTVGPILASAEIDVAPVGASRVTVAGDPGHTAEGTTRAARLTVAQEAGAVTATLDQSGIEGEDALAAGHSLTVVQCLVKLDTMEIILPTRYWIITHLKST